MTRSGIWIGIGAFALALMSTVNAEPSNSSNVLSYLSIGGTQAEARNKGPRGPKRRPGRPNLPDIFDTIDDLDLGGDDDDGPDDDGPDDDGPDDDDDDGPAPKKKRR